MYLLVISSATYPCYAGSAAAAARKAKWCLCLSTSASACVTPSPPFPDLSGSSHPSPLQPCHPRVGSPSDHILEVNHHPSGVYKEYAIIILIRVFKIPLRSSPSSSRLTILESFNAQ